MNKAGPIITIVIAAVLIVLIVWRSGGSARTSEQSDSLAAPAPDTGAVTLDGKRWNLADQRGKVVLLDFWATWCGPCVASVPDIKKIHDHFKEEADFVLVGVNEDRSKSAVESFIKERQIDWLQLFDVAGDKDMGRKFGVGSIPATFLIDQRGNFVQVEGSPDELIEKISRLLKARP